MPKSQLDWLGVVSLWVGAVVLASKSAEAPLMSESVAKAIRSAAEDFEAALYALPSEAQESPLAKQIREHYNRLCSFM